MPVLYPLIETFKMIISTYLPLQHIFGLTLLSLPHLLTRKIQLYNRPWKIEKRHCMELVHYVIVLFCFICTKFPRLNNLCHSYQKHNTGVLNYSSGYILNQCSNSKIYLIVFKNKQVAKQVADG